MTHRVLSILGLLVFASLAARVSAAPIDLTLELDPGQTGPVYTWSLRIRVDPGYDVGGVAVLTSGFTSFAGNEAHPPYIDFLDSGLWAMAEDGRRLLTINSGFPATLLPPLQVVLLGQLLSPFNTTAEVTVSDCEADCGYTVINPTGALVYPRALISLTIVPEPSHSTLAAFALLLFAVLRALERRAVGAAELEPAPLE